MKRDPKGGYLAEHLGIAYHVRHDGIHQCWRASIEGYGCLGSFATKYVAALRAESWIEDSRKSPASSAPPLLPTTNSASQSAGPASLAGTAAPASGVLVWQVELPDESGSTANREK